MGKSFEEIMQHGRSLKEGYSKRDTDFENYEKMYLLDATDLPSGTHIKKTVSPDARNALLGAHRLLTAADVRWQVPIALNDNEIKKQSDKIEKIAGRVFQAASRAKRKPIHNDVVLAALLYGEAHIAVTSTKDLYDTARTPGEKRRAEQLMLRTPLLFSSINPKMGYPEFDEHYGLTAYYVQQTKTVRQVLGEWGKDAEAQLSGRSGTEEITYHEYYDVDYHAIWLGGQSKPILLAEHKMDHIPILANIIEGSTLFEDVENTRQPFLYTLMKSKLWERQNLGLTLVNSLAFSIGANPMFVFETADDGRDLEQDWEVPGGLVKLRNGEKYGPLAKQVIDPSLMQVFEIATEKGVESTLYRQALGEPMGSNAPYSMVALLSQAGRLPLVPYQRMVSWLLGDAMYVGLQMIREEGETKRYDDADDIDPKDIPEVFEINAKLEISMPQDQRQNAAIANQLAGGPDPMTSKRYVREEILGIENPDEEQKAIWEEQMAEMAKQMEFQQQMMAMQQQQQMMMQQQQGPPQMGPGMDMQQPPPPGQGQGIPPELMQQMMMEQQQGGPPQMGAEYAAAQEGLPMSEPLPGPNEMPMDDGGMNG